MNKLTKRLLALVLSVLMVMSVMPTAFAEDAVVEDNTGIENVEGETSDVTSEEVPEDVPSEEPSLEEPEVTSDSLLFKKPYVHNVTKWHTSSTSQTAPDTDCVFLTDGLYADDWWDKANVEYFGAQQSNVEIVFDFEATVDFSEVYIAFLEDIGSGIYRPDFLSIYAINGEEETLIYDAKVPALSFSAVSDAPITADKLKVVTSGSTYTFIDEVEVYAEAKNEGYAMGETAALVNHVAGMTYTIEGVTKWYNGDTDDSAATKLTDGVLSWGKSYKSVNNFGANSSTAPVITFNFDEVKDIAEIDIYAIFGKDGIGAPPVVIEYADAEGNWIKVADIAALEYQNFLVAKETLEATALRFTFAKGFCFLGEIQVYDRVTNMAATNVLVQNDNFLLGKSYTSDVDNWNDGASKDAGNALTDGVKGGDFYGPDYFNAKETEVTIDFALEEATDLSEIFMQFYSGQAGIELPSKLVVSVQEADDANWVKIYEGGVAANNFRLGSAGETFKAKNIKFYFEGSMFIFIKEIEAYKHLTGNALDNTLELVPDNFNILAGKTYTHDVTKWYGGSERDTAKTRLTDGVVTTSYKSAAFNPEQAEATVNFEFDEDTAISELVINAAYGGDGTVAPNVLVSIKDSDDAEWTDVYKGNTDYETILKAEETLTAKYLKFTFFGGASYKFISEIAAYSLPRKAYEADATMAPIQYSLIKGLVAETNIANYYYGGTKDLAVLTDAVVATDAGSVKSNITWSEPQPTTFTYTKEGMSFKEISFVSNQPADGDVTGVAGVVIEALIDGEWETLFRKSDFEAQTVGKTYAFGSEEAITADAIRLSLTKNTTAGGATGWGGISLSEISVFAEPEAEAYDGTLEIIAKASAPTVSINGGIEEVTIPWGYYSLVATASTTDGGTLSYQWYKNDEALAQTNYYYTMFGGASAGTYKVVVTNTLNDTTATAEATLVIKENPYFKNVAEGKSYEWVSGMWGAYPDAGTELTDGVLSSWRYHENEAYAGAKDPEIILDLGAVEEIYRVATLFMSTGGSGLALPSSVKYQYSTDKETWYDFGAEWTCADTGVKNVLMITDANVTEPVEAQYIKMNATGGWVFLGEFMAYAEVIEAAAPVIDVDLVEAVEVEAGGEATLTVEASTTDAGELSYQWYKDDVAIEGATEATYTATVSGTYKVVVTNTLEGTTATAESTACVVTVKAPEVAGYAVTVNLKKSGSTADTTVELVKDGAVAATATISGKTGSCTFDTVAPGAYTIKVSKSKHAAREYAIEVVDAAVAQDVEVWLYGDVTADGIINSTDIMQINRRIANMTSVFNQTANADYRLIVANITKITQPNDTLINSADIMQINRRIANMSSIFDRIA